MFELPENLSALSAEELQALIDQGLDALRALAITPDSDEAAIVEGERIMAAITSVNAAKTAVEATQARRGRAEALIQAQTPVEPEPAPETPDAPETPENPPVEAVTPPVVGEVIETTGTELVTAAGRQSPARRAAANGAPPAVPATKNLVASLVAAADVPGIPTGAPLEGLSAAATALLNRMKAFPTHRIGGEQGTRMQYGAALIQKQGYGNLVAGLPGGWDDYELVQRAGDESRLPGGSLVAAGGWCSPSETLYDLCQYETVAGLLDLPEIGISRGGIRWTQGPDFGDIYDACGFQFTESEVIAGTAQKTCCIVDCPPFEEIRADLIGLCVKAPFLTQATYPELVRRFMEGALVAHQHKVNAYLISLIDAAAGPASFAGDMEAVSLSLGAIGLAAMGMRYRYRMSENQTVEVVAPWWLNAMIKEDLGMRTWNPDASDAVINKWFSDRNLSVQWVYDWQPLDIDDTNPCLVTFPDTVDVLIYPAGTWVKGSIDVINMDAVYDSTSLEQNIYTALFVEEGILAVQRCTHTCKITVPVCASGRTPANDVVGCVLPPGATAPTP